MTQPAKAQEPSMEEILASIRRIIADDDATKSPPPAEPTKAAPASKPGAPAPRPPQPAPLRAAEPEPKAPDFGNGSPEPDSAVEDQSADILELTESMAAPAPAASAAPQFRTIDGASDVSFDDSAERAVPEPVGQESQLISRSTRAAVDSAFNSLAQTVLVQNARTLEDLVREMLRPMLKSWLDENLPGLVERLVRAEIERVSRGR
jgi:cell pole-organizing protein PopZ